MVKSGTTTAPHEAKDELACNVARFEQLVAEHSDRLERIELLLAEIAAEEAAVGTRQSYDREDALRKDMPPCERITF